MIKLVSWNVNSVRTRISHLTNMLQESKADIVMLQEIKCLNEMFPNQEIEDLGYNIAVHGQKSYNGVAIISKYPIEDINIELPDDPDKTHSRYIEALVTINSKVIRVASVYVPNGQEVESEKFQYKLKFFDSLHKHLSSLIDLEEVLIVGGDFNVAPEAIDVYDETALEGTICFHIEERKKFRSLLNLGLIDAYRMQHPEVTDYTWWDYRAGAFSKNKGMRIDHFLLSPQASNLVSDVIIDKVTRQLEKSSDHAPIELRLNLNE